MIEGSEYSHLFIKKQYEVIKKLPTDRDRKMARAIRKALKNKEWKQIVHFLSHPRLALLLAQTEEKGHLAKIIFIGNENFLFSFPKISSEIGMSGYKMRKDFSKSLKIKEIL